MYRSMLFLHVFFAMVWVGGMVFSLLFLHPAVKGLLSEEVRAKFVQRVLGRFFLGVWLSIAVLFLTGMWMWHSARPDFSNNSLFHIKLFLFTIMVLNLTYIHLWLLRRKLFSPIPNFVGINLILGVLVTLIITYIR